MRRIIEISIDVDLDHDFLIESWVSFPTEPGKPDFVTTKLNYVTRF